jgi:hypothetical protein
MKIKCKPQKNRSCNFEMPFVGTWNNMRGDDDGKRRSKIDLSDAFAYRDEERNIKVSISSTDNSILRGKMVSVELSEWEARRLAEFLNYIFEDDFDIDNI